MKTGTWAVKFDLTLEGKSVHFDKLSDISQEHILDQIKEGFFSGELIEEDEEE